MLRCLVWTIALISPQRELATASEQLALPE